MPLDKLQTFYYVAKLQNMTKASDILKLSQPSVSRQMSALERILAIKLMTRHQSGIRLTPAGEKLFHLAQKVITDMEAIKSSLKEGDTHEPEGYLKVVTTIGLASTWLVKFMAGFLEKYPKMRVNIIDNGENLDLKAQQADAVIRPFIPDRPDLLQIYLNSYTLKLYASQAYLKKFGTPEKPEDLDYHRLITFSKEFPFGDVNWLLHIGTISQRPRIPFLEINSVLGLSIAAQDDLGIVSLPSDQEFLKKTNLVEILPEIEGPTIHLHYIYPLKSQKIKRITALGEYLANACAQQKNSS